MSSDVPEIELVVTGHSDGRDNDSSEAPTVHGLPIVGVEDADASLDSVSAPVTPASKSLSAIDTDAGRPATVPALKRALTWPHLVALGIGCTIGSGIFVVTGEVAHSKTGPALFLSYIVSGLASMCAALCYAEFAAMSPETSGSAYAYAKSTLGTVYGWIIGWDLILEYAVAASAVSKGFSSHFQELITIAGGHWPDVLAQAPLDGSFKLTGAIVDLPAVLITVLLTVILVRGIKESAAFNALMVAIKVGIVLFVIAIGSAYVDTANFSPFMPYGFGGFSFFGTPVFGEHDSNGNSVGVLAGASIIFFAYVGFDSVSTQSAECKNPQRDLPRGIVGSLAISTALYVAVSVVLVGMVPYTKIDTAAPFSIAFESVGLRWAEAIVAIGALCGITSVLLVTMLGQPRILLAMANDNLLPPLFTHIHPTYDTPDYGQLVTGVVVALFGGFISMTVLVEIVSIGTLFAFVVVSVSVIVLRRSRPDLPRPFRCPWSPVIPGLGALMCLLLMLSLPYMNWIRLIVWLIIGLVVYFVYGRRRQGIRYSLARESSQVLADGGEDDTSYSESEDEVELGLDGSDENADEDEGEEDERVEMSAGSGSDGDDEHRRAKFSDRARLNPHPESDSGAIELDDIEPSSTLRQPEPNE